ncbi:GNAT family N-acetyltransferase [Streptococcus sp. zg-JUN1979]|uniref:GNAT family N-acetyltransferase n=1 Tax=Streptococcus sp. zg-JUN1979 TaxID=3391450 RepID=UPI0039A62C9F
MSTSNGDMKTKQVRLMTASSADVKGLYYHSFPKEERLPYVLLTLGAYRHKVDFDAYYDKDAFCGFSYTYMSQDYVYVLFLAVNDKYQGQGYGTQILESLKAKAGDRALVLTIEPLDESAANYQQRLKRLAFYERNGFKATPYTYHEKKERYTVLSTRPIKDKKALEKVFKDAVAHLIPTKITK